MYGFMRPEYNSGANSTETLKSELTDARSLRQSPVLPVAVAILVRRK
jgi:hypothetical protein